MKSEAMEARVFYVSIVSILALIIILAVFIIAFLSYLFGRESADMDDDKAISHDQRIWNQPAQELWV